METRKIGNLTVSVVGLGCNNFGSRLDARQTANVVAAALDSGVTLFDTADIYGKTKSEEYLGLALKARRGDAVIATKFGMPIDDRHTGARPEYVRQACQDSLRRLGTEWIDLYQLHQPDPSTPIAATLEALDQLVKEKKVREIGCSNFDAVQLQEATSAPRPGAARFVSVQNEYSLLNRTPEASVIPESRRQGLAFIPYFPLASGLLTGKYRPGEAVPKGTRLSEGGRYSHWLDHDKLAIVDSLARFAEARGHTMLELAISWLLAQPTVASVIAGATSPEQVQSNAKAGQWKLTTDELKEVDTLLASTPS